MTGESGRDVAVSKDRPTNNLPSAHSLYVQAEREHPHDRLAIRARYNALLREHGLIVCKTCGRSQTDPEALSCSSGFHRKGGSDGEVT